MITREKTVTMLDIAFKSTGRILWVQAESIEKAHHQIATELRSMLAELRNSRQRTQTLFPAEKRLQWE
ncbi:MAG TPA: hypothetical protein VHZ74_02380 [Bryobacteraceae bacterium]|nr:hypothetical protein [Bryobacteraceae bacterium]